jgi:signal transduction histidine kinase
MLVRTWCGNPESKSGGTTMGQNSDTRPLGDVAAATVNRSRTEVLRQLEHELRDDGGALSDLEAFADGLLDHADGLLTWLEWALRTPGQVPAPRPGHPRPASRAGYPRPVDMVRMAGVVGEAVMSRVAARPDGPVPADVVAMIGCRLQQGLLSRLGSACDAYQDQLLNRLRDVQQADRRRVGRELHDRLGHDLSVAYRGLESFEAVEERAVRPVDERVVRSREAVRGALEYVRSLAYEMQLIEPVTSLGPALRGVVDILADTTIAFRVAVNGDESWARPELRDEVFLVLREAMRNAHTHARTRNVLVRVNVAPDELHAIVEDDGIGFEPGRRTGGGSGLESMSERIRVLGGRLTISRPPGGGSRVELSVPLGSARAESAVAGGLSR